MYPAITRGDVPHVGAGGHPVSYLSVDEPVTVNLRPRTRERIAVAR
jgi:hypothetical protein